MSALLRLPGAGFSGESAASSRFLLMNAALWRQRMSEEIARRMDADALGVKGVYLFGSTNSGEAGTGSDIDLIIHVDDDAEKRVLLHAWLDGWNEALCALNEILTGCRQERILDVHLVTDADIARHECFATKIHSVYEPVLQLRLTMN